MAKRNIYHLAHDISVSVTFWHDTLSVNQSEWKKRGWFVNILIIQTLFLNNFTDDTIKKKKISYDGFGNK